MDSFAIIAPCDLEFGSLLNDGLWVKGEIEGTRVGVRLIEKRMWIHPI